MPRRVARAVLAHRTGAAIVGAAAVCASSVGLAWFRTGSFYAHGDLTPWVRTSLQSELGAQWTHQNTGAGGPTYEIVRLIEVFFLDVARLFGGTDTFAQRLFFAALFAFAASGAAAVASRLTRRALVVFAAGVIGAFNPLIMVNLPNFLIALLIGLAGWATALTIDAAAGGRSGRPRVLAVLTMGVGYLALNPPLLAMLLILLAALPLLAAALTGSGRAGALRALRFLVRAAAWAIPLSLWWVVPYLYAIRTAAVTGTIQANTDVFTWSWTHVHNSLDRVLMLVAKWSWPDRRFGWSASALASRSFLWIAFVLPVGALAAPLLCRPKKRRAALWIVTATLALAFVAKGLNGPLRAVNAFAYAHVPGMFLLREPMSKVGGAIAVGVVAAWVLSLDGLIARTRVMQRRRSPMVAFGAAGVVLLSTAPVLFAWPMLTGSVVQPRERVEVPAAWRQVARIVDTAPLPGKVLVLPLDDFYQVPTTWGYYGSDVVPTQLFDRPTIARHPEAYIGDPHGFEELRDAAEVGLVGRDVATAAGALRALGVSYLVVRKDIDFASEIRTVDMSKPEVLTAGLTGLPGVRKIAGTAIADVFEFSEGAAPVQVLSGTIAAPRAHGAALAALAGSVPRDMALATSDAKNVALRRGESWRLDVNAGRTISPPTAGDWVYERRAAGSPVVEMKRDARGLVLHEPVSIAVDGRDLATRRDIVVVDSAGAMAVDLDGTLLDLGTTEAYARIAPGTRLTTYRSDGQHHLGQWSRVADCNRVDGVPVGTNALRVDTVSMPDNQHAIRLRANRHSACVSAPARSVGSGDVIQVALEQRGVQGNPPRTCLWQPGLRKCAPLAWSATRAGSWYQLSAIYRVPPGAGAISMFLYADGTSRRSEAWYRNVTIGRLLAGHLFRVPSAATPTGKVHLDAGPIAISTRSEAPKPIIGARTGVGDCARRDDRSLTQLGIEAASPMARDSQAVHLSARSHSACVSMPVFGLQPGFTYEIAFDALVERGARPRMCLWEDATRRCARLQPASTPDGPGGRFVYRGQVGAHPSAARLFLYADAQGGGTTIEYSHLRVRAIVDESVVLRPASIRSSRAPEMTWRRESSSRYRVHIRDAGGPFVLAMTDAFSGAWHVSGLPRATRVEHVELDGYRNGWSIDARGDMDLTVEYTPAHAGHLAFRVSELTVVVLLALAVAPRVRRARRWRRRVQSGHHRSGGGSRRIELPDGWISI